MTQHILTACQEGISGWQQAFNQGNAAGCADHYAPDAIMVAKPFEPDTYTGREQIRAFWQNIINQRYAEVTYQDVTWEAEGIDGYILTAKWTMNKAFGAVHREHWKIQPDGKARLVYDEFEVQGEI